MHYEAVLFGELGGFCGADFSRAFSGMTEAWNFVTHGCDLDVNLKADKLNPNEDTVF